MMNNCDVAIEFVKCFCAGDVDALAPLLTPDLKFKGPFFKFDSADAYLDSLKNGYQTYGFTISLTFERPNSVRVITPVAGDIRQSF